MHRGRSLVARFANVGLVVFGMALVVVLGTGGTRLDLRFASIGLRQVASPLTFFCFFAALRLLAASRSSGLEARLVTFLARQGLPPRDAPSTLGSSARAGGLLGLGFGFAVAVADIVRLVLATAAPGPTAAHYLALALVLLLVGPLAGGLGGALAGAVVATVARALRVRLGRYEAGRWTVALLLLLLPAAVWSAPESLPGEHSPGVLMGVTAAVFAALGIAFVVVPTAVQRARRGRWGLAVAGAAGLALALCCVAVVALGPGGISGQARDAVHPNVLVVSVPGLRPDHVGAYFGEPGLTPTLGVMAGQGALFKQPVSTSVVLAAASASILTGTYPATHGIRDEGDALRPGIEGLPVALAAHGYRTAAFVSSRELSARETGFSDLFESYDDPTALRDWLVRTSLGRPLFQRRDGSRAADRRSRDTVAEFREWVAALPRGPWFAWVQLADLLRPVPEAASPGEPDEVDRRIPGIDRALPAAPSWSRGNDASRPLADWLRGYAREVRRTDGEIDALRRTLAARGDLDRTLIVVIAEQALPLGENGSWFEGDHELVGGVLAVPWVLSFGPAIRAGTEVAGPCSLVDAAPTILGLVGLPGGRAMDGEDLSRYLVAGGTTSRDPHSGPVFSESAAPGGASRARAVRLGPWKLVRAGHGEERFFKADEGFEHEIAPPRGSEERQRQQLSDMLMRRQAQEENL